MSQQKGLDGKTRQEGCYRPLGMPQDINTGFCFVIWQSGEANLSLRILLSLSATNKYDNWRETGRDLTTPKKLISTGWDTRLSDQMWRRKQSTAPGAFPPTSLYSSPLAHINQRIKRNLYFLMINQQAVRLGDISLHLTRKRAVTSSTATTTPVNITSANMATTISAMTHWRPPVSRRNLITEWAAVAHPFQEQACALNQSAP